MIDVKKISNEILSNNKLLYCMYGKPMTETCMCWGLEVPDVWLNEIDDLSKNLEGMNLLLYPKYRVRIQMDQLKEKFGTLRAYYSIAIDPPKWICEYENVVDWLMKLINKLDFKYKLVVDHEAYDEIKEEAIQADKVEETKKSYANVSNVEIIANDDGSAIKKTTYHHYKKTHNEPTRFKWLHSIMMHRYQIKNFIRNFIKWEPSYEQRCVAHMLDSYAYYNISKAEKVCTHICEKCGRHIGEDYSPRCVTHGWISYLCEKCADESNSTYSKNGELWCAGKKLEKNTNEDKK